MLIRSTYHILTFMLVAMLTAGYAAAANSAGLVNGMWFSKNPVTDFSETVVYSVVHNQTDEVLEGIATLVVDGVAVGVQEVRVGKANIERIAIPYTFTAGTHTVHMNFTATGGVEATHTKLAHRTILVSVDTDGDGVPDNADTDDDNDGLLDTEDDEPLVKYVAPKESIDLTESGKLLLMKITQRNDSQGESDTETTEVREAADSSRATSTIVTAVRETITSIEDVRTRSAAAVRAYEEEQRAELEAFTRTQETMPAIEGFEPPVAEQSKKRELQIAAAGASMAGTMLEKSWLFYSELVVLTLGVLHLLWVGFQRRFANVGIDDEEE